MELPTIRRVDLNLLYILRELLKEPNTTKVGEKLGLTQSAVSAALGRLRWAFQDDLFVRSGRNMAPTRRAEEMLEPVEDIISRIEELVEHTHFEPEALKRTFAFACADFIVKRVAAPMLARMLEEAPSARLVCVQYSSDTRDRLRSGHLDLMLAPSRLGKDAQQEMSTETLYSDHLVAAVWKDSKAFRKSLSEAEFLEARHIDYNLNVTGGWVSTTRQFMHEHGLDVNVVAEYSTQMSMMSALQGTDTIAVAPAKLVELVGDVLNVRALELPYAVEEFDVDLIWNQSFDNDPEHRWFRGLVQEVCRERL